MVTRGTPKQPQPEGFSQPQINVEVLRAQAEAAFAEASNIRVNLSIVLDEMVHKLSADIASNAGRMEGADTNKVMGQVHALYVTLAVMKELHPAPQIAGDPKIGSGAWETPYRYLPPGSKVTLPDGTEFTIPWGRQWFDIWHLPPGFP